jgi:transposase-like protein
MNCPECGRRMSMYGHDYEAVIFHCNGCGTDYTEELESQASDVTAKGDE